MIYLGVDPGKSGAMAIITKKSAFVVPFDEDWYLENLRWVRTQEEPAVCCLEHVGAMPGQGVTSMFSFGQNFGWIQGALQALSIPYELIRPQKWKKEFSITGDKNSSIAVCKRLFPDVSLLPSERCRKDSADLAEAVLMAEYARRKLGRVEKEE